MLVICVMYPAGGSATFDYGYYTETHIPLVRRLWNEMGLQDLRVLKGSPGPDGKGPTYMTVALITFSSIEKFQAAAAQHGAEIFGDIPNFTNTSPVLQFNDPLS